MEQADEGPWPADRKQSLDISTINAARLTEPFEELPFFGPPDPNRWPLHKTFFLSGLFFPPLWYVGGWLPVRDEDDNWSELFRLRCQAAAMVVTIIAVALLVLLTAFNRP